MKWNELDRQEKVGRVFRYTLLVILITFVLFIGVHYVVGANSVYQLNIIKSYLHTALETNSIVEKSRIVTSTLDMLEPYNGNSEWLYPDEHTNMDTTKRILATVQADIEKQIPVPEREQWLALPHKEMNDYINGEVDSSVTRLGNYVEAYYWNPTKTPMLYLFMICILGFIFALVMAVYWMKLELD